LGIGLRASQRTQADRQKRSQQKFLEHFDDLPASCCDWRWDECSQSDLVGVGSA
jgi:hypothetical protein